MHDILSIPHNLWGRHWVAPDRQTRVALRPAQPIRCGANKRRGISLNVEWRNGKIDLQYDIANSTFSSACPYRQIFESSPECTTMEALATLGIAANVVQFLQFSGQLISEALVIKRTGSPSSASELKKYAVDLTKLASEFKTPLDAKMQAGELSQEDEVSETSATAACVANSLGRSSTKPRESARRLGTNLSPTSIHGSTMHPSAGSRQTYSEAPPRASSTN